MNGNRQVFILYNLIIWFLGIILYYMWNPKITALLFISLVIINVIFLLREFKTIININLIFNVFYVGTISLACLQLIGIEKIEWNILTWACMAIFNFSFYIFSFINSLNKERIAYNLSRICFKPTINNSSFGLTLFFSLLSLVAFVIISREAGGIPLFSLDQSAYTDFGSGNDLALFYQISVIIPGICMYEIKESTHFKKLIYILLLFLNLGICILVKSRDFLTGCFTIMFVVFYFRYYTGKKFFNKRNILITIFLVLFVLIFFYMTSMRNYTVSYNDWLYDSKASPLPKSLIPIYAYITSPYYNFNKLVQELDFNTYGILILQPIWILFHIYPIRSMIDNLPTYFIKPEINMYSSLGAPYFDFGFIGIIFLGIFYGYFFSIIESMAKKYQNPYFSVLYGIIIHHLIFVFFTSWISNFQYFMYTVILFVGYMFMNKKQYYLR